jgi:hypothetical protein
MLYVLSLIEGPLRKWFLPEFATPLYFLRDPFLVVLYLYALSHGYMLRGRLARAWLFFAVLTTGVGIFPFLLEGIDFRAWALGGRTYWLYLPLAFVVANAFRREDFEKFVRLNVMIALPYAALVVYQYKSPPFSWINRRISEDDPVVGVALGLIRPNGLFTYTSQNVEYATFLVANFVAFSFMRREKSLDSFLLMVGTVGVGSVAVLTGSRSIYFIVVITLLVAIGGSFIARPTGKTLRQIGLIVFSLVVSAYLMTTVYSDMFAAMQVRVEDASRSEGSLWDRLAYSFNVVEALWTAPVLGYGIGTGTPSLTRFLGVTALRYGEGELQRVVNELGILFGGAFLLFRWYGAGLLLVMAFRAAQRGYPALLPFAGYAAYEIALGQITASPLNAFLPWLVVGLCLSLASQLLPIASRHGRI